MAGYSCFADLVAANKAGRAKVTTLALETDTLERLRTKNKIQGRTMVEHKQLSKGNSAATVIEVEEIDGLFDDNILPTPV